MSETSPPPGLFGRIRRFTESDLFESVIATLLVLNALTLLLEALVDVGAWDTVLWRFFLASQAVFVAEIALRILGYGPRFGDFFKDGWNVFDFVLVAISLIPDVGTLSFAARVIRVLRALRVLRLVSLFSRRKARGEGGS